MLRNQEIGLQNKIVQILTAISAGKYQFEMAVILGYSLLISSILPSSETQYGVTLECSSSNPRELIYMALVILRIRDIIKNRRILFLHHTLKQKESCLLFRFFLAQVKILHTETAPTKFQNTWKKSIWIQNFRILPISPICLRISSKF